MKYTIKRNSPKELTKRAFFKKIISKLAVNDSATIEGVKFGDTQIIRGAAWDVGVRVSISLGGDPKKWVITVWRIE